MMILWQVLWQLTQIDKSPQFVEKLVMSAPIN